MPRWPNNQAENMNPPTPSRSPSAEPDLQQAERMLDRMTTPNLQNAESTSARKQGQTGQQQNSPPTPPNTPAYDYQKLNPEDAKTRIHPYNGETVIVSRNTNQYGFAAKWRATRRLQGWRWVKSGAWVTPLLNSSLSFEPLYWRKFSNLEES